MFITVFQSACLQLNTNDLNNVMRLRSTSGTFHDLLQDVDNVKGIFKSLLSPFALYLKERSRDLNHVLYNLSLRITILQNYLYVETGYILM